MTKNAPAENQGTVPVASANAVPAYMQGKQGAGTEKLNITDMEVPRVKLIQAISPEISEFTNVKPGEFWHTLAEESLGKEVRVVPIYVDKRYILWKPRKSGGGILARADDGIHWNPPNVTFDVQLPDQKKTVKWRTAGDVTDDTGKVTAKDVSTVDASGLAQWGSYDPEDPNSQPAATLMYTFVIALPDYPELGFAQLTLQRGSVSVAKNLLGKIRIHQAPSYGRVFKMSSVDEKNGAGDPFKNFKFVADGFVSQDVFPVYENLYEQFAKDGLKIKDLDNLQDEVPDDKSKSKNTKDF